MPANREGLEKGGGRGTSLPMPATQGETECEMVGGAGVQPHR